MKRMTFESATIDAIEPGGSTSRRSTSTMVTDPEEDKDNSTTRCRSNGKRIYSKNVLEDAADEIVTSTYLRNQINNPRVLDTAFVPGSRGSASTASLN